jgi:lysozyme
MEKKYELALSIIKEFEEFSKKAYYCPANVLTIGYGRTTGDLKTPTNPDAETQWLYERLQKTNVLINKYVKPSMNPQQMAALMSLIYNIGDNAFIKSTLLKTINSNSSSTAIKYQWNRWNKGRGLVLPGLIRRRKAELELYFSR